MAKQIEPIRHNAFGAAQHRVQNFDAVAPAGATEEDITSPDFWVNVANPIEPGAEIRVRAEDDSFVAYLYVTYAVGNKLRLKTLHFISLDAVDYDALSDETADYLVKQRGPKKWCLIENSTGTIVKELIPTQKEAIRERDDLIKALAS